MKKMLVTILAVLAAARMAALGAEQGVTLSFSNAPLETVVETYHDLTGKTMLVSPSVQGVTLTLAIQGLKKEDALLALETLLYENGIGIVAKQENLLLVCKLKEASRFVSHLITDAKEIPDRDYVVSYQILIGNLDPNKLGQTLGAFTSGGPCQIVVIPEVHAAVITGPASLVKSVAEIVRSIDLRRGNLQESEDADTQSPSRNADNIQVDFRVTFRTDGWETNCVFSLCACEGEEISAKEVTDVPYFNEQGSNACMEVGTIITATAMASGNGDGPFVVADLERGIGVAARIEVADIVSTNTVVGPLVGKSYVEFTSIHRDAAFVKVWSADSQASRLRAVHVRAFRIADGPEAARHAEKAKH